MSSADAEPTYMMIYRAQTGTAAVRVECKSRQGRMKTTISIDDEGNHGCVISCTLENDQYALLKTFYHGVEDIEEAYYIPEWECITFRQADEDEEPAFIDVGRGSIRVNNTIITPATD
jgi:hypothetical protein